MRRVETVIRIANGPSNDDGILIGLKAVAHGQDQGSGIYPLVEEATGVSGGESLEDGMRPLLHAPALVLSDELETDLKSLGELDLILGCEV